jgi:Na+-translocating ferredoxin:NAD+ oxidoreductase RNF subunit RnfB
MIFNLKWLPIVDEETCTGCGLCVDACGPRCLGVADGVALLLCGDPCGSEEHCVDACPEDAIHMQWIPYCGNSHVGLWRNYDK